MARLGLAALGRAIWTWWWRPRLGYTARAVLENAVCDRWSWSMRWPSDRMDEQDCSLGKRADGDPRCRLVHGDFFAMSSPQRVR